MRARKNFLTDMPRQLGLLLISILLLFVQYVYAQTSIPSPRGRINDFAGIMTQSEKERLASLIQDLENHSGTEMAIVTIESLHGENIEGFANQLFNEWGIGKKGKNNGLLILVAVKDRKIRIEVGYGLEGVLPDGFDGDVIRNTMVPLFREGRYGDGIYEGAHRLATQILGGANQETAAKSTPANGFDYTVLAQTILVIAISSIVFLIVIAGVVYGVIQRWKCPKCGRWLKVENRINRRPSRFETGIGRIERTCSHCGFHDVQFYSISRLSNSKWSSGDHYPGGGWGGFSGGGFGGTGFGGGSSGGGGASGSW